MKAAVCRAWGGPEVLRVEDLPEPSLLPGHVRVAVRAAGIAFQDSLMIAGKYQTKPDFPVCPGNEICGDVLECGAGVVDLKPGDRIVALLPSGGYCEQAIVPERAAIRVAKDMDPLDGAALGMAYGTAYQALVDRAQLKSGEWLLVRGAAGGVGLAAVQIGVAFGARVIASASSPARRDRAKAAGAHHLIDSNSPAYRDEILAVTAKRGADVILDTVGANFKEHALRCIAWRGRILIVGFAGGEIPEIPAHYILNKFCSVSGVMWGRSFFNKEPESYRRILSAVASMYEQQVIKPHVGKVVPLAAAGEAMSELIANRLAGRAVIAIDAGRA